MILPSRRILKAKSIEPTQLPFSSSSPPSDRGAVSMELPPLATPTPQSKKSKKRLTSASCSDADVVEVPPPTTRSSKSQKTKEVLYNEVIDGDSDEDSIDLAVIGTKVNKAKKGKAIVDVSDGYLNGLTEVGEEGVHTRSMNSSFGLESSKTRQLLEPCKVSLIDQQNDHIADTIKRREHFKRFDTVEDYSDHHYNVSNSTVKKPPKPWAKRIQEEWKILEKDLPETIFVRVYEGRMDLLRAVILGSEGTPYHDGLFFFDISFPSNYPHSPPEVYYHAHGLRLNPNLYEEGYVCLSLLNTWDGNGNEMWQPKLSTMLQVLVSIQVLILNAKPYFNEPGYEIDLGTNQGEGYSIRYNEDTFIMSLQTMSYTMRKPPKYFEGLVAGHFMTHAEDIVVACRAYLDGAQVGCVVKGGVQEDLDAAGHESCSDQFKKAVISYLPFLVKDLTDLGLKGADRFLPSPSPSPSAPPPPPPPPVNKTKS